MGVAVCKGSLIGRTHLKQSPVSVHPLCLSHVQLFESTKKFSGTTRNEVVGVSVGHTPKHLSVKLKTLKSDYKKLTNRNSCSGSDHCSNKWSDQLDAILGHVMPSA